MPDPTLITARGQALLDELPPFYRTDPDVMAVMHAYARELNLLETAVEQVRSSFVPSRCPVFMLAIWEDLLGLSVAPEALTEQQRRDLIIAFLQRLSGETSGSEWEVKVAALLGSSGWSYEEHDPADGGSPEPNVIRITLEGEATSQSIETITRYLREITPANLQIDIVFSGGFILDVSQLDVQPFNA